MVHRYLALLHQGLEPKKILTVTFTTEAAIQLRARILRLLKEEGATEETCLAVETTPLIGTIHSLCYGLLDQFGSHLDLEPIHQILTTFKLSTVFDEAYRAWVDNLPTTTLAYFLSHFSHTELRTVVQEWYVSRNLFRANLARLDSSSPESELVESLSNAAEPLLQKLENKFSAQGIYSFDDLEHFALRILREAPDVAYKWQTDLRAVLVDEFQDTSQSQWEIIKLLLGEDLRKLFVVGDPKQSIYSFRHADVRLFLSVARELERLGGETQELTANFRTTPSLLNEINHVASFLFEGTEIPFSPMQPGRKETKVDEPGLSVHHYDGADTKREASRHEVQIVVSLARELVGSGVRPSDIAILFRVSDRIPDYFDALVAVGIPAICKRIGRLFECYDVMDIANYLRVVHNPLDEFALAAFLLSRHLGLTAIDLWNLQQGPGGSFLEKVMASANKPGWLLAFFETGELSVDHSLRELFKHSKSWPLQSEAVYELLSALSDPGLTVGEAVQRLEAWEKEDLRFHADQGAAVRDGIRLMTVHAAKGLEYRHVLLVDNSRQLPRRSPPLRLAPGAAPGFRYRVDGEPITTASYDALAELSVENESAESKRILYVALTRAQERLYVFLPRDEKLMPKGSWARWLAEGISERLF